ncbi:MAG TPA: MFS transporter [Anaerolineales bacterium]|nr:MFS transporter [Anaerolineales bacterium]
MDIRTLYPILLVIFTNILGAGVILPILPLYAEGEFNGTVFQITLLATAFFGAQFLAAPWLGRLSDRIGRRPVLLLSQLGTILAFILFIFAGPLGRLLDARTSILPVSGGMAMLYAARLLDGITGGNITTAQAYVSDITDQSNRAHGLGLLQGAFGLGFVFGPAFGGILSNYGPTVPFIGATLITSLTFLLTLFTLKESLTLEDQRQVTRQTQDRLSLRSLIGHPALLTILGVTFFATLAFSALPAIFALYAQKVLFPASIPPNRLQLMIGLMLTMHGLITVITQVTLLRPLVRRWGEQRLLVLGDLALFVAMLGVGAAIGPLLAVAAFAPFAFGQGVTQPSLQSLMTRFGRRGTGGQLLGLYQAARSLALIFGPVWAGFAFEQIGPRSVFYGGAGLMALSTALAIALLSMRVPSQVSEPGAPVSP